MKLSNETIKALGEIITGTNGDAPYQSGPDLVSFFNQFTEEYDEYGQGFPSRWMYAEWKIEELNQTEIMNEVFKAALDPRRFVSEDYNLEKVVDKLNFFLKFDGYELSQLESGFYGIHSEELEDSTQINAHFSEIKSQILDNIESADFLIWVAVAWFTDRDLGNSLFKKLRAGVNVQIIVNDDDITAKSGLRFEEVGFEYYKFSPLSPWGKKIMHNKFCIIDLKKVIHGSYNWTTSAQYNNETITVSEDRKITEQFAKEFIQLKSNTAL